MSLLNGSATVMTSDKLRVGTPDPTAYHPLSAVTLEQTGKPLSSIFGEGNGTVIPRATMNGASRGWKASGNGVVNIYTKGPGETLQGVTVDVQTLRNPVVSKAAANAMQNASSMDELGATAMQLIHAAARQDVNAIAAPPEVLSSGPRDMVAAAGMSQQMLAASVAQQTRPQPAVASPPPLASMLSTSAPPPVTYAAAPVPAVAARIKLTIDIPNGGRIQAYYHQVIRSGRSLVLVSDTRQQAVMTYEPPDLRDENGDPKPYPILVQGAPGLADTVYLVYFTGVVFQLEHYAVCALLVEQEQPYDARVGS